MREKYKNFEVLKIMQIFDIPINRQQKETTEHGPASFPLAVYHSVMSRNILGFTNWHWHDELQFCLVVRGSIHFFVNNRQQILASGQGIFINSGCLHMAKPVTDPDSTYICLNIHPRLLGAFPGSVIESRYVAPYLKNSFLSDIPLFPEQWWQKNILDRVLKIYRLYEKKEFAYELEIYSILSALWLDLVRHLEQDSSYPLENRTKNHAGVQKILTYISRHYSEPITLDMIAKELSFSVGECCRMFKRITGQTIISYLTLYRISKSIELLRDTDLSISQIAYETGFSGTSYFIEKFKKQLGTTPLKFRKEL